MHTNDPDPLEQLADAVRSRGKTPFDGARADSSESVDQLQTQCFEDIRILIANGATPDDVQDLIGRYQAAGLWDPMPVLISFYEWVVQHYMATGQRLDVHALAQTLGLGPQVVAESHARMQRVHFLSELEQGRLPVLRVTGRALQRGEVGHFAFDDVEFFQERVVERYYEGGSAGVSFRVAKGVTLRLGGFRGRPVSRTALVHLDTGQLLLTSKRLLFSGPSQAFALPYTKILNVTPYEDAISVLRDSTAQNNRPFVFMHSDMELLHSAIAACLSGS